MTTSVRLGVRLTVYLDVRDQFHHRWLMVELVARARAAGLSGATVFRAERGYGHSGRMHAATLVSDDSALRFVVVDEAERVDAFTGQIRGVIADSLVLREEVEILTPLPDRGP